MVEGFGKAARRAREDWGVTALLIPCLLRHLPVGGYLFSFLPLVFCLGDEGLELEAGSWKLIWCVSPENAASCFAGLLAEGHFSSGALAGLGLCSTEIERPPALYRDIFALAREHG